MFKAAPRRCGALIGHSYVKNILRYVDSEFAKEGILEAIDSGEKSRGRNTARVMSLNELFYTVTIDWAYLFESPEWIDAIDMALSGQPEILVVNMASNDLCEILRKFPQTNEHDKPEATALANRMMTAAIDWRDNHGVQCTVFLSVLKRVAGTCRKAERFTKLMDTFNDTLRRRCDFAPGISFKPVEGFDCFPDGAPMAVEDWSNDGAHPGRDFSHPSFVKYYQEVRAAFFGAIPQFY